MALFVICLVVAVIAAFIILVGMVMQDDGFIVVGIGFAVIVVMGACIMAQSYTAVPARNLGVETKNGKPSSQVLTNGGHWLAPWAKVQTFDATVQPLNEAVVVRLKNNTTATVDVNAQWQIDPNANFLDLYRSYRTFDNIKTNVVSRQLSTALNIQFESFDPLGSIDASTGTSTVSVQSFAPEVLAAVKAAMPAGLNVNSVTITKIVYSAAVESQINSIITAAAQTRVAQQQLLTNQAIAAANKALETGGTLTETVVQQNCLAIVKLAIQENYALDPGFGCLGNASPVTVK